MTNISPPKPTREDFLDGDFELDVIDAAIAAVRRYERIPPAKRKALMDKGLEMGDLIHLLTLQIMSMSPRHLSPDEVDAIFEMRELHGD